MPASFQDLANAIAAATQVFSNADGLEPGMPLNVQVVPGFSAAGGLDAFQFTVGAVSSVLQSAVDQVDVSIHYQVLDENGNQATAGSWASLPAIGSGLTDPLQVKFLLGPLFGYDNRPIGPRRCTIRVTVDVKVEGVPSDQVTIDLPVILPSIPVPSICMFAKFAKWVPFQNGDGNQLVVFIPGSSAYPNVGAVLGAFNKVMGIVQSLKDITGFLADTGVLAGLELVAGAVESIPTVAIVQGNAADLDGLIDDFGVGCGLLIGYSGDAAANPITLPVAATLFSDGDWELSDSFSTWQVASSTPVPVGIWHSDDLTQAPDNNTYQHGGDDFSSAGSFKWGRV